MLLHTGKREIKALRVKCSNEERGCEWVGTVGTLKEHVVTCGFALVPCPKQCKDDTDTVERFMKKDLDKHLKNKCPNRDHKCEYCGEESTYAIITEAHDNICKMKPVPCPNDGCKVVIQCPQVSEHVSKCPHTLILCKYEGIGCATEMKRQDMVSHEQDDKLHLHMALETVATLKEESVTLRDNRSQIYALSDFQKKKDTNSTYTFSDQPFYTHPNGYHMTLTVLANGCGSNEGTHVSASGMIVKGKYDNELKWPFVGSVTITLLNQLEDKNHHTKTVNFRIRNDKKVGDDWGRPQFIRHSALAHTPAKNIQYLKDDTLYFKMSVVVADHKPWLE
jgi:hypothetical protein